MEPFAIERRKILKDVLLARHADVLFCDIELPYRVERDVIRKRNLRKNTLSFTARQHNFVLTLQELCIQCEIRLQTFAPCKNVRYS